MQIIKYSFITDILFLTSSTSEIRSIMQKEDLDFRHGLVLLLENQGAGDLLIDLFLKVGATLCRSFKKPTKNIPSTGLGVHVYSTYDRESDVLDFLETENFLPIIITYSFVPDFLKAASNVLIIGDVDIKDLQADQILAHIDSFRKYAREDPPGVRKKLRIFKTSNAFLCHEYTNPLHRSFLAVTDIFADFYRYSHDESETERTKIRLQKSAQYAFDLAEDYENDWDILDAIKDRVFAYIDDNPQILIDRADNIEGSICEAVEKDCAILCDANYYYFPEKILRNACSPLLLTISFIDIKSELHDNGILFCNSTTTRNFTVKKLLTNAYGKIFRVRFLKLKKEFFVTPNSLGLEERRYENTCLSEISTEKDVK